MKTNKKVLSHPLKAAQFYFCGEKALMNETLRRENLCRVLERELLAQRSKKISELATKNMFMAFLFAKKCSPKNTSQPKKLWAKNFACKK